MIHGRIHNTPPHTGRAHDHNLTANRLDQLVRHIRQTAGTEARGIDHRGGVGTHSLSESREGGAPKRYAESAALRAEPLEVRWRVDGDGGEAHADAAGGHLVGGQAAVVRGDVRVPVVV